MNKTEYRFGRFRLIPAAHELWRDGRLQRVPPLVFDCLAYLARHRDRLVGRDELVSAIWGKLDVADAQVRQLIARARRAVDDDAKAQQAIRTVPGVGYRWVLPLDEVDAAAAEITTSGALESDDALPSSAPTHAPVAEMEEDKPAAVTAKRSNRLWLLIAILLIAAIAVPLSHVLTRKGAAPASTPTPAQGNAVVVVPLEVSAPIEASWVRLGGMDLVATRLRNARLPVPPADSIVAALHSVDDPQSANGRDRLRQILGAAMIVQGSVTKSPSGWHVSLSTATADGFQHRIETDDAEVITALQRASDRLLAALGHAPPLDAEGGGVPRERLQQAQAAMLAGKLDAASAILTDESVVPQNDSEVRFRLAQLDFLGGRLDAAEASLKTLLDDAGLRAQPVLQSRALNLLALVDFRHEDCVAMQRDATRAVSVLPEGQSPADSGQALATRSLAGICTERWEDALADLGQARLQMEAAGDRLGVARVDQYRGRLELRRSRPAESLPYFKAANDVLASFGAVEPLINNLLNLVDAQSRLLQWSDALATSERLWSLRDRMADPDRRTYIGTQRATVLIAVGRYKDTEAVLTEMRDLAANSGKLAASSWNALLAELAFRRGRYRDAVDASSRALAKFSDTSGPDDASRAYLELLRQRASIAAGTPVRDDRAWEMSVPRPPALLVARAEWATHERDAAEADRWFREASAVAEKDGTPEVVVIAAEAYAKWLLGQGRTKDGGVQASRVAVWADRDFDCALLQVAAFHALGQRDAWTRALKQAQALAGERQIPAELLVAPVAIGSG